MAAKAKRFIATCEDCGNRTETNRKNMKYCHSCRLLRNLMWLAKRPKTQECLACDREFQPIERGAVMCGMCDFVEHYHGVTPCVACGEVGPAVRSGVPVCWGCATDPAKRKDIMAALVRGQRARVTANGWTQGTETPLEEMTL